MFDEWATGAWWAAAAQVHRAGCPSAACMHKHAWWPQFLCQLACMGIYWHAEPPKGSSR